MTSNPDMMMQMMEANPYFAQMSQSNPGFREHMRTMLANPQFMQMVSRWWWCSSVLTR